MNSELLFSMALGLQHPWRLQGVEFKTIDGKKELHITIDFEKGTKFCDDAGNFYGVYDTREKTWRHLNFLVLRAFAWIAQNATTPGANLIMPTVSTIKR